MRCFVRRYSTYFSRSCFVLMYIEERQKLRSCSSCFVRDLSERLLSLSVSTSILGMKKKLCEYYLLLRVARFW
jgi:hypothetical protein